jgi:hypothetical protein
MKSHDDKPDNDIDGTPQEQDQQFTINLSRLITATLQSTQWAAKIVQSTVATQQWAENIANQILDVGKFSKVFAKYFQRLEELGEKLRVADAETAKILNKYKWPVSPSMPFSFMFKVIELHRQGGNQRGAINKLFVDYFSANDFEQLSALIETWKSNPLFEPRMKIFRDCVAALKQADGRYNASNIVLPTLIAQIDGILTKYMEQKRIPRYVTQNGRVLPDRQWKSKFRAQTANQYSSDLLLLTPDILLDVLFQNALPGHPLKVPFTFSRHKVMHGEYTRYGRIDNTFRAFLILDFLSELQ